MANRIRWCARFAGTFLLSIDKTDTVPGDPWIGHLLSRSPVRPCDESFPARDEQIAKEAVENTIRYDLDFGRYAHRLDKELNWKPCDLSEEEWQQERTRFIETGE